MRAFVSILELDSGVKQMIERLEVISIDCNVQLTPTVAFTIHFGFEVEKDGEPLALLIAEVLPYRSTCKDLVKLSQ